MNSKINDILNDVIHTASQAILAEDEAVKHQAMADIVDALACVIPTERVAARSGVRALPNAANRTKISAINGDLAVVATADVMGRKFCAEANWKNDKNNYIFDEGFVALISEKESDDGTLMARIEFNPKVGGNACMKMLRGVLIGISSHYGHKARLRANKRNRLALTVERELAATVARQMDDDDLAQQIENS